MSILYSMFYLQLCVHILILNAAHYTVKTVKMDKKKKIKIILVATGCINLI
jgi:hypothetical protein